MDQVYCDIDIGSCDNFAQPQLAMCCGKSDHGLQGTHRHRAGHLVLVIVGSLLTDHSIDLSSILDAFAVELWCFLGLHERDILLEEISGDHISDYIA